MISTPYKALKQALEKPDDWQPEWAERLEVRRHDNTTVYIAHPDRIGTEALTELHELANAGWNVSIDSQRLNRIRINIWH